jgi:undecaprenyl-diphosphatase
MDLVGILILAVVQGLTEFLPISSDGHLVVVSALYQQATGRTIEGEQLTLTIVLHAGTLLAVLVVFRRQILRLATSDRRVVPLLVVGTLPVGVIGMALKVWCKPLLESPTAAGVGLIITGVLLRWMHRFEQTDDTDRREYRDLGYGETLVIGLFQAAAALPGVSRSGSTIASGLGLCGLKRADAANFSFLLSIPAVGGAVFLELVDLVREGSSQPFVVSHLAIGAAVSFVVGLFALNWLLRWLQAGRLHLFAWWCIPLGIGVVAWQLARR